MKTGKQADVNFLRKKVVSLFFLINYWIGT